MEPETTWEGGLNTFTEWRFNRETRQLQKHVCGVPGSWEREGRLRYAATTANVTSYANYSAEVPPKSKELLIL